jgi:hypothetical protein
MTANAVRAKVYESQYVSFIDSLNRKRSDFHKMHAIVLKSQSSKNVSLDRVKIEIDEVVQVLQFHFNGQQAIMLTNLEHKRVFIAMLNDKSKPLNTLECAIKEEFGEDRIMFELSVTLSKGLDKLCSLLIECVEHDDGPSLISVNRFARPTNTYLVLCNHREMQDKLTKILQYSGNVILFKSLDTMIGDYNKYSPEIVFIHDEGLKDRESKEKIKSLLKYSDPLAQSIVISEHPEAAFVVDCKKIGIKGFLLWPTSHQAMFSRLSKVPGLKFRK